MSEPGRVIAVVDDDASVRRSLSRLLRAAGYQVETFAGHADFLARPSPALPACLVLDVTMPGVSGLELYEALAASGRAPPVVFITGHGDSHKVDLAMKAGPVELLSKPFEEEALLGAVERAIGTSRA
jgi:FixJ family two-component response regulator